MSSKVLACLRRRRRSSERASQGQNCNDARSSAQVPNDTVTFKIDTIRDFAGENNTLAQEYTLIKHISTALHPAHCIMHFPAKWHVHSSAEGSEKNKALRMIALEIHELPTDATFTLRFPLITWKPSWKASLIVHLSTRGKGNLRNFLLKGG